MFGFFLIVFLVCCVLGLVLVVSFPVGTAHAWKYSGLNQPGQGELVEFLLLINESCCLCFVFSCSELPCSVPAASGRGQSKGMVLKHLEFPGRVDGASLSVESS